MFNLSKDDKWGDIVGLKEQYSEIISPPPFDNYDSSCAYPGMNEELKGDIAFY